MFTTDIKRKQVINNRLSFGSGLYFASTNLNESGLPKKLFINLKFYYYEQFKKQSTVNRTLRHEPGN